MTRKRNKSSRTTSLVIFRKRSKQRFAGSVIQKEIFLLGTRSQILSLVHMLSIIVPQSTTRKIGLILRPPIGAHRQILPIQIPNLQMCGVINKEAIPFVAQIRTILYAVAHCVFGHTTSRLTFELFKFNTTYNRNNHIMKSQEQFKVYRKVLHQSLPDNQRFRCTCRSLECRILQDSDIHHYDKTLEKRLQCLILLPFKGLTFAVSFIRMVGAIRFPIAFPYYRNTPVGWTREFIELARPITCFKNNKT